MDIFGQLLDGIKMLVGWEPILIILAGVVMGILVGVLPGLSPAMGVALLVPFSYGLEPLYALFYLFPFIPPQITVGQLRQLRLTLPERRRRLSQHSTAILLRRKGNRAKRSALPLSLQP